MVRKEVVVTLIDESGIEVQPGNVVIFDHNDKDCIGIFEGVVGEKIKIRSLISGDERRYLIRSIEHLVCVVQLTTASPLAGCQENKEESEDKSSESTPSESAPEKKKRTRRKKTQKPDENNGDGSDDDDSDSDPVLERDFECSDTVVGSGDITTDKDALDNDFGYDPDDARESNAIIEEYEDCVDDDDIDEDFSFM